MLGRRVSGSLNGLETVYTKVCRSCLREAHKNCCKNYDNANRSTRRVIKHILCVDKIVDDDV